MELQRSEHDQRDSSFIICESRFALKVEAGEGLMQQQEKRELNIVLLRFKKASFSKAEAASMTAEVFLGSSPWELPSFNKLIHY